MRKRITLLAASLLLAAAPALALTSPAAAATGDVTCPNGFLGVLNVAHNLTVPAGDSCGLTQGSTIGNNVYVDSGAAFYVGGITIGHDLIASGAQLIEIGDPNNGSTETVIGGSATITGEVGGLPYGDFICQTRVYNLSITDTVTGTPGWDIGAPEPANCGRNATPGDIIGNNAVFTNNEGNYLDVGGNQVGHNVSFKGNVEGTNTLTDNTITNDCVQAYNHPFDGSGNTAGGSIDHCNSSNP